MKNEPKKIGEYILESEILKTPLCEFWKAKKNNQNFLLQLFPINDLTQNLPQNLPPNSTTPTITCAEILPQTIAYSLPQTTLTPLPLFLQKEDLTTSTDLRAKIAYQLLQYLHKNQIQNFWLLPEMIWLNPHDLQIHLLPTSSPLQSQLYQLLPQPENEILQPYLPYLAPELHPPTTLPPETPNQKKLNNENLPNQPTSSPNLTSNPSQIYNTTALLHTILTNTPPRPSTPPPHQLNPSLPEEFQTFFQNYLSPSPQNRNVPLSTLQEDFQPLYELCNLENESLTSLLLALLLIIAFLFIVYFVNKNKKEKNNSIPPNIEKRIQILNQWRTDYISQKMRRKNMILIPAGTFTLGRNPSPNTQEPKDIQDEIPAKEVYLDAFWIDKYEITIQDYLMFAETVAIAEKYLANLNFDPHQFCHEQEPPQKWHFPSTDFGKQNRKKYPVHQIDWFDAYAFSKFVKLSLPTEAQWEKAAKGTRQLWQKKLGKNAPYPPLYPWGNQPPKNQCNYADLKNPNQPKSPRGAFDGYENTAPIDAFPNGQSIYGVYNLAGNVQEFVLDQYDPKFFQSLPNGAKNPIRTWNLDTDENFKIVIKGGGYLQANPLSLRCSHRAGKSPLLRSNIGFRCVAPATPQEIQKYQQKHLPRKSP